MDGNETERGESILPPDSRHRSVISEAAEAPAGLELQRNCFPSEHLTGTKEGIEQKRKIRHGRAANME